MIQQDLVWTPFLSLFEREVRRFGKVIVQTVVAPLVSSILYLLIFGVSLGQQINVYDGIPYLAFLIPGLMMMAALNNSYQNTSSSLVGSKFHGDLQDLKLVPLSATQIVWAMGLGALVRAVTVASTTFLTAELFFRIDQGQWLPIEHPPFLLFYLIFGSLTFANLGIAVGFRAKSFEQLNAVGSFILLPLLYLGGVFFSLDHLHPIWQKISQFNPLLYLINGIRYSILGRSDLSIDQTIGVTVGAWIILYVLAVRSVKKGHFGRW